MADYNETTTMPIIHTNITTEARLYTVNIYELEGLVSDHFLRIMVIIVMVILCQIVCVFGTVVNIMNLIVFVRIGFTDTIYITLTALAFTDFGACFVLIWYSIALNPLFQELDLPFVSSDIPHLISSWPHVIFTRLTTILTAFISLERCLCVVLPLKVKTIITRKVVKIVVICTYMSGVVKAVLVYSCQWYDWKFYPERNKTLLGLVISENNQEMESVYYPILYTAVPFSCFVIVVVSAVLLVSALIKNSKWKQEVIYSKQSRDRKDKNQSISTKEMKVAKMVTNISIIYICCSIPHVVFMFVRMADPSITFHGTNRNLFRLTGGVFFFLQLVNSSCNIFVYYNNSSAYRAKFDQIFRCLKPKKTNK